MKYNIITFHDGEPHIELGYIDRKEPVMVHCRITNPRELFILMQVIDILDRQEVIYRIFIYYLMGMRMDRVMDFNRPFTLKIISDILNRSKAESIFITEPHSDRISFFNNSKIFADSTWSLVSYHIDINNYILVFPDKGAQERYCGLWFDNNSVIKCSKVRDVKTGQLSSFKIENPELIGDKPLMILDDLCDGGGTFVGVANEIKKIKPDVDLNIYVTHMVNYNGLTNLSMNFNHVWYTNSYCDWKGNCEINKIPFPDNVTQINIV